MPILLLTAAPEIITTGITLAEVAQIATGAGTVILACTRIRNAINELIDDIIY